MFRKRQKIITRKRGGSRNEENLLFYDYIAAPLDVWQWQTDVTPEMNKLAMTDLLAAVGRAKELFPFAKCVSVQDGGSWGRNGYYYPPENAKAFGRLELVEKGLEANRWDWACHEFHDMLLYCSAEDKGILFRLIQLVENHIGESTEEVRYKQEAQILKEILDRKEENC